MPNNYLLSSELRTKIAKIEKTNEKIQAGEYTPTVTDQDELMDVLLGCQDAFEKEKRELLWCVGDKPIVAGDHLVSERLGFTHHGLYMGDSKVIHYMDDEGIEIVDVDTFNRGHDTWSATHIWEWYDKDEALSRAVSRVGEKKYNLIWRNCEGFVNWAIDGIQISDQVVKHTIQFAIIAKPLMAIGGVATGVKMIWDKLKK